MTDALAPLRVGDLLHGFCAGHFGRDSFGPKRVEAIGADWVVVREVDTQESWPLFSILHSPDQLAEFRTEEER